MEGSSRRTVARITVATLCATLAAIGGATLARASAGPPEQTGTFALLGGTPKIVSKFWATTSSGLSSTLHVRQFAIGSSKPIFDYSIEMQKTIHLVVIRDDFATFDHLHAAFNTTTGTFVEPFTKEPNHRYYVYADTTPRGIGQQVFRFSIESDGPVAAHPQSLTPSAATESVGPYTVELQKTTLPANEEQSVELTVNENGHPAGDLGSYLGAPAHCVFINTSTLQYVHVHPMVRNGNTHGKGPIEMNMSGVGPLMELDVPALPPGTYKLWVQFRGKAYKLYTIPFTLAAH